MTDELVESDELAELTVIATTTLAPTIEAMQASIVMTASKMLFYRRKELFFTHPANTFLYSAARALEERAVVQVSSVLDDENKVRSVKHSIRRRLDLKNHRDALSHPTRITWSN